jgi:hypothetical protein
MNALKVTFLLIAGFFINVSATAQLTAKYSNYREHRYGSLRYGLFSPLNYDEKRSYPLIVYLHGSTDTVSRDLVWYEASIQSANPSFVLTPKCEESNLGWGDTWHDDHTIAASQTLALVGSLIKICMEYQWVDLASSPFYRRRKESLLRDMPSVAEARLQQLRNYCKLPCGYFMEKKTI